MANVFAGSEIVEMGVEIEKNGRDFYNTLIKRSKNKKAAEIFDYLAREEEKHIIVFQKILESVKRYEPQEAYPGEYFEYMRALAGEYIFTKKGKGEALAKKAKGIGEAINMGIGFEKDSILFYSGMKKSVPEDEHKVIDQLMAQEENHLKKLLDLKQKI